MKFCPNCRLTYDDSANACGQCGGQLSYIPQQAQVTDPTDHTAKFSPEDISANKVLAMIPYLMGWIGIIITLLASGTSPYASFHVKQALKIQVVLILATLMNIVPFLGWLAYIVVAIILVVVQIICFINVCKGKAKEPAIICNISFLK